MTEPLSDFERYRQRYLNGEIPWDDPTPPPEVIDLVLSLPPGRGLDLGCGYGRCCIYLALQGWTADGVDYVPEAIAIAQLRAKEAGVEDRTNLYVSSATDMPFLTVPYDLVVDIGYLHSFDEADRRAYYSELLRLLPSGGRYLLFARLLGNEETLEESPRGIAEETVLELITQDFELIRHERGISRMENQAPWASGWFWFRRR